MIVEYFKLKGFPFRSSEEEKQFGELVRSNLVVRDRLIGQIGLLEGTSADSAVFKKQVEVMGRLQ